jgi:hypothetical protein
VDRSGLRLIGEIERREEFRTAGELHRQALIATADRSDACVTSTAAQFVDVWLPWWWNQGKQRQEDPDADLELAGGSEWSRRHQLRDRCLQRLQMAGQR